MKKIITILYVVFFCCINISVAHSANPKVRMETNHGPIVLELFPLKAPKTVENFLSYVREGFYDGTIFHRVIKGFMIQGGGLTIDLKRKPTRPAISNEADNGLKNLRGTIAMARTSNPHSATAQFFINTVDNAFLDHKERKPKGWGYCVFGKVVEGMETVVKIEGLRTTSRAGRKNMPALPAIINSTVEEVKK